MIRVGIIGTGGMAHWHARHFQDSGQVQIVSVCDVVLPRARAFAAHYGASQVFTDYRDLLAAGGLDAVSIVTPNHLHAPVTLAALAARLHILCEKPMALTVAEATEMVAAAEAAGVIHVINFSHRPTPCFTLARRVLAAGHLGHIFQVQATYFQDWLLQPSFLKPDASLWRRDRTIAGSGQLGDLGVHLIDLLYGMVGDIISVQALLPRYASYHPDLPPERLSDDIAALLVEFAGGAVGQITASRVATGVRDHIRVEIYGSQGALRADNRQRDTLEVCAGALALEQRAWMTLTLPEREREPDPAEVFITAIQTGVQPPSSFHDGLRAQRMLQGALEAAASGRQVLLG